MEGATQLVALLEIDSDKSSWWPFMARTQPFSDRMTVIGSFSTKALVEIDIDIGLVGEIRTAAAQIRFLG
jgi:hypothetical protein